MANVHTSAGDWKAAAAFLGEVTLLDSFAELDEVAPPLLRALFHADLVVWERFTNDLRHVSFRLDPLPERAVAALHPAFERHFAEHPGYRCFQEELGAGIVFLMSDFGSTGCFLQTGLWREAYMHLRAKHQLGFSGRIDDATIMACSLNRLGRDYGPRDREVARFIRPRLLQATQAIRRRERIACGAGMLGAFLNREESAFGYIARDGRIVELSHAARALLNRAFPSASENLSSLPEGCAALRRVIGADLPARRRFVLVRLESGGSAFVFVPENTSQPALVLFQEDTASRASFRQLSRRELEVLGWIGEGKADADIAALLGISARTVGKHCENIFTKLGVENRTAAAVFHRQAQRL